MIRTRLAYVGLVSLFLGACLPMKGSGVRLVETRELPAFTRIDAGGTGQLQVTVDGTARDTLSLEIEGDDNIVPLISTSVVDGALVIRRETDSSFYDTIPLRLRVAVPQLEELQTSGSIDVRVDGLREEALVLVATGSSDVTVSGEVTWLELESSGSADVFARQLRTTDATVRASNTSDVEVCAVGSLTVEASGSSDVTYFCSPMTIDDRASGSADITPG